MGTGDGFCSGDLVAAGEGTPSGTTLRVGSGNGDGFRLALLFAFALLFSFAFAGGLISSSGSGDTSAFAFGLALTFAGGAMLPPAGIPCSPFPVGDAPGCTGWLFGSAASVVSGV